MSYKKAFLLPFCVSACMEAVPSSPSKQGLNLMLRPGTTFQQYQFDDAKCVAQAARELPQRTPSVTIINGPLPPPTIASPYAQGYAIGQAARQNAATADVRNRLYASCMSDKGYRTAYIRPCTAQEQERFNQIAASNTPPPPSGRALGMGERSCPIRSPRGGSILVNTDIL